MEQETKKINRSIKIYPIFASFTKIVLSEKALILEDVKQITSPVFISTLGIASGILISEIL